MIITAAEIHIVLSVRVCFFVTKARKGQTLSLPYCLYDAHCSDK